MTHVSFPFKKSNKAVFQKPATALSQDSVYWKQLGPPTLIKEYGAIDYIHFSPVEPYYFAATCSVRVQIYDPITKSVAKNISIFKSSAFGGTFRADGRLLVAGSEEGAVKLFDVSSKSLLRLFSGHTGPVHRAYFTKDQKKIISCSDDKVVNMWDVAQENQIATYSEHSDYIRAGATNPISSELFMTGSYDHTVKLFDSRVKQSIITVNHGSPVESTLFLPSGGMFISAGGTEIKVWDVFNAGRLVASVSQHHKTVTSMCLASNNSRLISGSLDRHVKIYDVGTFREIHNIDFPNAILSMAVSPNDDMLAVGMVDGIISIRKRRENAKNSVENTGPFKFAPDRRRRKNKRIFKNLGPKPDNIVKTRGIKSRTPEYEKHLRKMEFPQALAVVLTQQNLRKYSVETATLLQELLRRKVLHIAYEDLAEAKIEILLKYFKKFIGEARFTTVIIDAANVFVDVFEGQTQNFSVDVLRLYRLFLRNLKEEIEVCKKVCELEGALCLLFAGAQTNTEPTTDLYETLIPSISAQKEIVIDV